MRKLIVSNNLHLMVGAIVLVGGTRTFGAGPFPPLRLVNTRAGTVRTTCSCPTR
jgi:hypothetical protein